jgi:hypothetical protein
MHGGGKQREGGDHWENLHCGDGYAGNGGDFSELENFAKSGRLPRMSERDHGVQPVDGLIEGWGLTNHDLVEVSTEQLNHKQVQKARKGRQLTLAMMQKVARALNVAVWQRLGPEEREGYFEYLHRHLFNYAKGHESGWEDPNRELMDKVKNGLGGSQGN